MPYSHYHDFSFHTHHQRPKGGRHYRAVRRGQRPWRIGFILVLVVVAVWVALEMGVRDRLETALTAAGQSATDESGREALGREPEAEAKQTGHGVAGGFTAPATAPPMTPTAIPPPEPTPTSLVTAGVPRGGPAPTSPSPRVPFPTPAHPLMAAPVPVPAVHPSATVEPTTTLPPHQRHIEEKDYMLALINSERRKAGVNPVVLGTNNAAQLHAESSLADCVSSHWGTDGLKPYMRYSLAGGYQSNGENGHGLDYCFKSRDGYTPIASIREEILDAMAGWMKSPGHRDNILDPMHRKVNLGIAWDRYNEVMFQHFEGDYVEYDEIPTISGGILALAGRTRNGVRFNNADDLSVQVHYDPPPHPLTAGQVSRTYCYDNGLILASLREPLSGGWSWPTDQYTKTSHACPSPYEVPVDAPVARSYQEAHRLWQEAYNGSKAGPLEKTVTVEWITADQWTAIGDVFSVRANLKRILDENGAGVYTVTIWGRDLIGEDTVISEYSIFHGTTPPDTYDPAQWE